MGTVMNSPRPPHDDDMYENGAYEQDEPHSRNYAQQEYSNQSRRQSQQQEFNRLGDILKQVRRQRGEKLDDISEYLRIRPTYLHALEESHYDELPADAYVIGFLRTYANYLGLDGRAAVDQYRKEMAGRRNKPRLTMPQPISEGQTPSAAVIMAAAIGVFFIYVLWYSLSGSDSIEETAQPVLPQTATVETSQQSDPASIVVSGPSTEALIATSSAVPIVPGADNATLSSTTAPSDITVANTATPATVAATATGQISATATPAAQTQQPQAKQPETPAATQQQAPPPPPAKKGVVIKAKEESWVLIVNDEEETIVDKIFKAGETYTVNNPKNLSLTVSNGNGVVINLNGTDLPSLGDESQAVRGISLNPDKLKALLPGQ